MLIGDMETNGLLEEVTKIHCACFYDTEADAWIEFLSVDGDFPFSELEKFLDSTHQICMHNGIEFDSKVWKKLYGYEYKGDLYDTLLMSRLLWTDKKKNSYFDENGKLKFAKTAHSIENWGIEFGIAKPVQEQWHTFNDDMLHRCREDVRIQTQLYRHINNHLGILNIAGKTSEGFRKMETKVWEVMQIQANNGWEFDIDLAYVCEEDLQQRLDKIDSELVPSLPFKMVSVVKPDKNPIVRACTLDGKITARAGKWVNGQLDLISGDFCKVKKQEISLGSPAQVKEYLLSVGWVPATYNFKKDAHNKPIRDENRKLIYTTPKIPDTPEEWEIIAKKLKNPAVTMMAQRGMIRHRLGVVKGLIDKVRADGRVSASANTVGTNTHRMTHKTVVNIPKADPDVFYGKEMRSLFRASKDLVMVGCDASALEARCEAHYIYPYDPAAALELIDGDIHTKNAQIWDVSRNVSKSGKYAILYGCSPPKLAETLGKTQEQAQRLYDAYWGANPALLLLKEDLERQWRQTGHIIAIDGRPLPIRYEHAIINTLFQSAGSIAMKVALCYLEVGLRGYFYRLLGNFHDEIQLECKREYAKEIGSIMEQSLLKAGRILKFNVDLTSEHKIGRNWAETH